jgi:hypothetical protein
MNEVVVKWMVKVEMVCGADDQKNNLKFCGGGGSIGKSMRNFRVHCEAFERLLRADFIMCNLKTARM